MSDCGFTLSELAMLLNVSLQGKGDVRVRRFAPLNSATSDCLAFLSSGAYKAALGATKAGAVILTPKMASCYQGNKLIHQDPYLIFAKTSHLFFQAQLPQPVSGIAPSAHVDKEATIHPSAIIGHGVIIEKAAVIGEHVRIDTGVCIGEGVRIGRQTIIKSNATLCHGVIVGEHCIIHEGAVIGSEGFGFARDENHWIRIKHMGRVVIGNYVDVGANTSLDRGVLDDTFIGDNVILDNNILVAHNVKIQEGSAIAGASVIGGSTTIGKNCIIGGSSSIIGHIVIADNTTIMGCAAVTNSITEPNTIMSPGILKSVTHAFWKKIMIRIYQLDNLFRRVKHLEECLNIKSK